MATTPMLTNSPNAVKLWGKKTYLQMTQKSFFGLAMNSGVCYFAEELMGRRANRGDEYTLDYVGQLTGTPTGEGQNASQNAEGLNISNMRMSMNITRKVVDVPNEDTIEQQRTNIRFGETARNRLADYMRNVLDAAMFQQLAGAAPVALQTDGINWTGANRVHVFGHNEVIAPTSDRIIRPNGKATDEALDAGDRLTLAHLDYILEANETSNQPIQALPDGSFIGVFSPEQITDLKHDTTGAIQWFNIELSRINGGASNAIDEVFKNDFICAGKYANIWIYAHKRVAHGVHSSSNVLLPNVRRGVILGRDAISFASPFGGRPSDKDTPVKYFTDNVDIQYTQLIEARMSWGLKKMSPVGFQDNGVYVLSTYAASNV